MRSDQRRWSREELILVLDYYIRHPDKHGSADEGIQTLAALTSRTLDSIRLRVMNYRSLDPSYVRAGRVGMRNCGRHATMIWKEFAHRPGDLRKQADAIRIEMSRDVSLDDIQTDDDLAFPEGAESYRLHRERERNRGLVTEAKRRFRAANGRLLCEACGFDFETSYGPFAAGYIEAHHVVPVSDLSPGAMTRLSELAMLCANCHRVVHLRRPWLSLEELRNLVRHRGGT